MRKTIFIFLIIITSFIFIDNVYAYTQRNYTDYYPAMNGEIISSNFIDITNLTDDEITENYSKNSVATTLLKARQWCRNYIQNYDDVDKYFIIGTKSNLYIGFYNSNDNAYISTQLLNIKNSDDLRFIFYTNNTIKYSARVIYDTPSFSTGANNYLSYLLTFYSYSSTDGLKYLTGYSYYSFYDGEIPIVYEENSTLNFSSLNYGYSYTNVSVDDGELCHTLINGDILYGNHDFTFNEKEPTINFENIQNSYNDKEEIISISVDINLKNINNNKHLVQYTTQSSIDYNYANGGIEHWLDISPDTFKTFTTNINDTLYVRIIDAEKYLESADKGEELVIDLIDSATYTFTNIVETLPTIQYSTNIPNVCKITHNDIDYISCVELNMNVKNMNVNKYKLYRMYYYTDTDTYTDWVQHYNYQSSEYINENMTIFYKITDKEDNYITSNSVSIVGIKEFLEQGLFIEFSDKYLKNSRLVEITMKIANDNNYTYYYSTNNGLEYKVVQDITNINFNIKKGIIYTDTNGKILVKVVDSNGQVVNIFEHTINYKQLQMNNDSFGGYINNVFNFFITPITHIFSLITTFYTTLPTILQYLFSGIFILAIFYYIIKFIL